MPLEQCLQIARTNVAGAYQQQFPGLSVQQMRVVKIRILGDDDTLFLGGKGVESLVRGAILCRQLLRVDGVVSGRF